MWSHLIYTSVGHMFVELFLSPATIWWDSWLKVFRTAKKVRQSCGVTMPKNLRDIPQEELQHFEAWTFRSRSTTRPPCWCSLWKTRALTPGDARRIAEPSWIHYYSNGVRFTEWLSVTFRRVTLSSTAKGGKHGSVRTHSSIINKSVCVTCEMSLARMIMSLLLPSSWKKKTQRRKGKKNKSEKFCRVTFHHSAGD